MALKTYEANDILLKKDTDITKLYFITRGEVSTELCGETFTFGQGDVIGLSCLAKGVLSSDFIADGAVEAFEYPCQGRAGIDNLLQNKNADLSYNTLSSGIAQVIKFLDYREKLYKHAELTYHTLKHVYEQYMAISKQYAFSAKMLSGALKFDHPSEGDSITASLAAFYRAIGQDIPAKKVFFHNKPAVTLGFFDKTIMDIELTIESSVYLTEYLEQVAYELFNSDSVDLFKLMADLHAGAYRLKGADELIKPLMEQLVSVIRSIDSIDQAKFEERYELYTNSLTGTAGSQDAPVANEGAVVSGNLAESMDTILTYSGCDPEITNAFAKLIYQMIDNENPNGADDDTVALRKEITKLYYDIYIGCFMKSLHDPATPTIVKMFLNFGYIDPVLAGAANADYLYSIADSYNGDKSRAVYTMHEWLKAVYNGDREPSRNESDLDWPDHLRDLRIQRKITEAQEQELMNNQDEKIKFELENVLPVVNKITFGRISTYCPVFNSHNVVRDLESSLVTPTKLYEAIAEIQEVDFTAFYRERPLTDTTLASYKVNVHKEIMPEIVLAPNVGNRGIMWQERTGRNNGTPARMFISVFYLEDLNMLVKSLVGEMRWELTKRIQGARWSDITDPSLTSEYFDYLQFYRSSKELTKTMKEDVKTELTRSRNTYKIVFARNYMDWMIYESSGSQRLNKVARRILTKYVPFKAEVREKLSTNPQYGESIKKYNMELDNKIRQLEITIQKMERDKVEVPQEVHDEIEYLKR